MFLDDFDTYLERSQVMRRTGRYYQIVECLNGSIMEPFYQEELKKEKEKEPKHSASPHFAGSLWCAHLKAGEHAHR